MKPHFPRQTLLLSGLALFFYSCEEPRLHAAPEATEESAPAPASDSGIPTIVEWEGKTIPQLVTANGKTYSEVTFKKVEPDAITITHAGGVLRIPMEDLNPQSQAALGYDPAKAAAARKKFLEEKAASDAAAAQRAAAARSQMAEQQALAESEAARRKKLASSETSTFIVVSVTEDGPLVNTYTPGGYSRTQGAISSITGGGGGGYVSPTRGRKVYLLKGYTGKPLVDDDTFTAAYVETDETYTYQNALGAKVTASVIEALSVKP